MGGQWPRGPRLLAPTGNIGGPQPHDRVVPKASNTQPASVFQRYGLPPELLHHGRRLLCSSDSKYFRQEAVGALSREFIKKSCPRRACCFCRCDGALCSLCASVRFNRARSGLWCTRRSSYPPVTNSSGVSEEVGSFRHDPDCFAGCRSRVGWLLQSDHSNSRRPDSSFVGGCNSRLRCHRGGQDLPVNRS